LRLPAHWVALERWRLLRKEPTAEVIDTVLSVGDEDCIVQLDVPTASQ
jgi:hypothetical protein